MKLINVKFRKTKKVYLFKIDDNNDNNDYKKGDAVIVETARGDQIGIIINDDDNVIESDDDELKVRGIKRKLTLKEIQKLEILDKKADEAYFVCKKLVKEIMNRLDQEQKNKQNNLSIRTIYYLNYIFGNGSYEKAKELDKKFIPKILDKTNKNVFLNEKLPQEECEYLQYAIPNVNLNKLKITCVVAEVKKSQQ